QLQCILRDLYDDARRRLTNDLARIETAHAAAIVAIRGHEAGIGERDREAVQTGIALADRLVAGDVAVSEIIFVDVFGHRADRGGIGRTLHLALQEIPVAD